MTTNEHIDAGTLIDYLHGELTPERDAAVLAHLGACSACTAQYDGEAAITERIRREARESEMEMPAAIAARIRSHIEAPAHRSWLDQLSLLLRPAVGVPVAAGLVLAAMLGISSLHGGGASAPAIAASYYIDDHAALSTHALPFTQTPAVPESLQPGSAATAAAAPASATSEMIASE